MKSHSTMILLQKIAEGAFGIPRVEAVKQGICVICKDRLLDLKDDLSSKEYQETGLCKYCRSEVFGE